MIDPNLFKDFLSGDGTSEEYMRNALHIEQDQVSGSPYSLFDDQESLAESSLLNDDDYDDDDDSDDIDDVDYDDDDDIDDVDYDDDDDIDDVDYDDDDDSGDVDYDDDDDVDDIDDVDYDDGDDIDDISDNDGSSLLESMLDNLLEKAEHVGRTAADNRDAHISFGSKKICATRHGCTGATNCDYSYGAPIGI